MSQIVCTQGCLRWEAGGARIALHAELLPSLLPSEGAFSDVVDGLIQENFSGGKPPDPKLPWCCWETNIHSIVLLEKEHEDQNYRDMTKAYPCGGTYIYVDAPSEGVMPPALAARRRPCMYTIFHKNKAYMDIQAQNR